MIRFLTSISILVVLMSCGFKPMYKISENNIDFSNYSITIMNENNTSREIKEEIKKSFPYSSKIKKNYADSAGEATAFTVVNTNAAEGITTLSLTNTQTAALRTGRHVYDIELSFNDSSGNTIVERILEGRIQVTPQVT